MAFHHRPPAPRPSEAVFETTNRCDQRCSHCCASSGEPRDGELTTAQSFHILRELALLGCERVSFTGGEPLMREDWLALVSEGSRVGLRVGLMTNGVLFGPREASDAREAGVDSVGFSVDGIGDTHDVARGTVATFDRVRRAMEAARAAGLRFGAVTQLNSANLGELEEIGDFLAECGATIWRVQLGQPTGRMADHPGGLLRARDLPMLIERLSHLHRPGNPRLSIGHSLAFLIHSSVSSGTSAVGLPDRGCPAGRKVISILSNGDVVGCPTLATVLPRRNAVYGNAGQHPLVDIWNERTALSRWGSTPTELLGGVCAGCASRRECGGGCPGSWIRINGGFENVHCSGDGVELRGSRLGQLAEKGVRAAALTMSCAALLSLSSCGTVTVACPECNSDTDTDTETDTNTDTETETDTNADTDTDPNPDGGVDGGADAGR